MLKGGEFDTAGNIIAARRDTRVHCIGINNWNIINNQLRKLWRKRLMKRARNCWQYSINPVFLIGFSS